MIPKVIHYCWFGNNPKSVLAQKCIKSWKRYCRGYEIIEWNENNFDIASSPLYVRQAYDNKMWAFVTDYVRLKVIYEYGGIYMDTDVELKKNLNSLLNVRTYFGFENDKNIATGLGFGSEPKTKVLYEMIQDYESIPFILSDGTFDTMPCPERNTRVLLKYGLKQDGSRQTLTDDILILPSIYLCPISYETGKREWSLKTISIHWFSASWKNQEEEKKLREEKKAQQKRQRKNFVRHFPNIMLLKILGENRYEKLKRIIKS